jgi:glutamyl-tRNA synthetase
MATGRFAPSPTGRLHLGNLRTALLAWLLARSSGGRFLLRIEDLDVAAARHEHYESQPADLAAIGLDWDGVVVRQSERRNLHDAAIDRLTAAGLTYPCYCTRREVLEAPQAPHAPPGAYPGTCRHLTDDDRRARETDGRRPALRLRGGDVTVSIGDRLHGRYVGIVDDLVLRRGDGTPAYNLAVVVDDADQGVEEVVRGDDLLSSSPRQAHLARLLDLPVPAYVHVPLAVGADGDRLAKRHGATTLETLDPIAAFELLAASLGRPDARTPTELLEGFGLGSIPRDPWVVRPLN